MAIRAVFFDVGETLVDETRIWGGWADWLGVPRFAFFAMMGAGIERDQHHRAVLEWARPGFDLEREEAARAAAGAPNGFDHTDFYPDALPCLTALKAAGYLIGIAGNQPAQAESALRAVEMPVDLIATSAAWGVEKPSPAFFARLIQEAGLPPHEIAYVGDRLDNDVLPAKAAGMLSIFIRRGPWGYIHARRPEVMRADMRIEGLGELIARLASAQLP
ncbi:MAG: HAD-IA family hydrolase [Chloroflexi bacterium]|nr:HAD-IA family hydrolase [Chloroflexota bacterium]